MPAYYVDTSALLKRYRSERGSDVVRELFAGKRSDDLFLTSHLSILEVTSVASRLLKGRHLRRRRYERMLAALSTDLDDYDVQIFPIDDALVREALGLFPDYPLRAPDSLHFATALSFYRTFAPPDFYVVTGDGEIVEACHSYPLRVIDPEEATALDYLRSLR